MARHHTRCRKCRTRHAIAQPPEMYVKWPECACGGRLVSDKWMNERDTKAMRCDCDGMDFAYHRIGSRNPGAGRQCHYNTDGTSRYGPEPKFIGTGEEFPF